MAFIKAKKEQIWLKLLLAGPSGSGKTYSALRLAKGIANKSGGKIAAIDTEAGRIKYYANEFDFDVEQMEEPYEPEKYIQIINDAISAGYNILIIDSITHEWNYCLQLVDKMPGSNSYTKWGKVTPRHDAFKEKILQAPIHIIATVRGKDAYVLEQDSKGKQIPKKVGLGYSQRDGLEFDYTVTFNIDQATHGADATKDNTHLFSNRYDALTEKDGEALYEWANSGEIPLGTQLDKARKEIIALAKELGGQSNPKVIEACQNIIGTLNPNACTDINALNTLLETLKKESGGD